MTAAGDAPLQLRAPTEPLIVFAGQTSAASLYIHNSDTNARSAAVRLRLFQLSSATKLPFGSFPARELQIPAGLTTLLENAVEFPHVRAATRFQLEWGSPQGNSARQFATAVPTNLLEELETLSAPQPLGLYDPQDRFAPVLAGLKVKTTRLSNFSDLAVMAGTPRIGGPDHPACGPPNPPTSDQGTQPCRDRCGHHVVSRCHASRNPRS